MLYSDTILTRSMRRSAVLLLLAMLVSSTSLSAAFLLAQQPIAGATGTFDNADIADYAIDNFAVGSTGGQCRTFVNNVVMAATGVNIGTGWPNYFAGFENAGAQRITNVADLRKGDIVQQGQTEADPDLHTFVIVASVSGSTFDVIDSNHTFDEKVSRYNRSVTLSDTKRAYRLGQISEPTDPPANVNEGGGVGSATYRGDRLNSGEILYAGQYIASPNLRTALVLRANGDLVLYGPNTSNGKGYSIRWSQNTSGADRLVMQGDGNLVVYQGSTPRWWSGTGAAGSYAIVQNDGNFAVRNPAGASQWATGTGGGTAFTYVGFDRLNGGEQINSNQYIRSADGRYVLLMKSGGTLVLYTAGYHVIWYKAKPSADRLTMQGDGNLVMYQASTSKWSSGSTGSDTRAIVQGDGNFVIYDGATAIWNTKTSGQI